MAAYTENFWKQMVVCERFTADDRNALAEHRNPHIQLESAHCGGFFIARLYHHPSRHEKTPQRRFWRGCFLFDLLRVGFSRPTPVGWAGHRVRKHPNP